MQSLRERLAVGENLHSNAWDDTIKHSSVLQAEILRSLAEYLENRDIDSTGLREEAKTIVNTFRSHVQRVTSCRPCRGVAAASNSRTRGITSRP